MHIIGRVHRKLDNLARSALHGALSTPVARRKIGHYFEAITAAQKRKPVEIEQQDQTVVQALKEAGIYQTHLNALNLPETDLMLNVAQMVRDDIETRLADGGAGSYDPYLIQANRKELIHRPEIYYFGLGERILRIVENYLGMPVSYGGFNFFYTLADGRERGARVWHLDGEDERIVKVVVYLNNVDIDGGPFEMIRDRIYNGSHLYTRPARHEKLERVAGKSITADDIVTCVGSIGTIIFCDTAQHYHRGRPATGGNRTAIFFNYYPRPTRRPYFIGKPVVDINDYGGLSSKMTRYQSQAAKWREDLPALARYVLPK